MAFSFQVVVTLLSTSHRCRPPCDEAFEGERADRGVVYVTRWFDSRAVTRSVTPRPGTVGTSRNQWRSGFGDDHAFQRGCGGRAAPPVDGRSPRRPCRAAGASGEAIPPASKVSRIGTLVPRTNPEAICRGPRDRHAPAGSCAQPAEPAPS